MSGNSTDLECLAFAPRSGTASAYACPWWLYATIGGVAGTAIAIAALLVRLKCARACVVPFRDRVPFQRMSSSVDVSAAAEEQRRRDKLWHSPPLTPRSASTDSSQR